MRKLLSGYLFRMIKSPLMWALMVCGLIASVYFISICFEGINTVTVLHTKEHFYLGDYNQIYVDAGNAKEYRFESLGISALDVEQHNWVPIDQDTYNLLSNGVHTAFIEFRMFNGTIIALHYAPVITIALIIPVFFGILFSDGTIKNLVACGYSRRKIYFSALIYSFIVDSFMMLFNILVFICFCVYYEWKPPVYLPSSIAALIIEVLLVFTVSAVVVSALFASGKRTAAFVVGFLMMAVLFFEYNPICEFYSSHWIDSPSFMAEYTEFEELYKKYGFNAFENRFILSKLTSEVYWGDKKVLSSPENDLPKPVQSAIVTLIYLDPALTVRGNLGYSGNNYVYYSSGVVFIEMAVNMIWIAVSTLIGMACFKKRELH